MSGALDDECRRCDVSASLTNEVDGAGEKVSDEGDGGTKIAEYLVAQKII